eukprot:TRINITY_DN17294_c0_g1_i2.p1 TRINITY_DN17294_c0_g1~~TRINITY_DN17294_c0_g1_i2.p1  ORF type:complete len:341 (+),score=46.41 TRINITY_DN17294_c0_g1_i2:151-1173(+)
MTPMLRRGAGTRMRLARSASTAWLLVAALIGTVITCGRPLPRGANSFSLAWPSDARPRGDAASCSDYCIVGDELAKPLRESKECSNNAGDTAYGFGRTSANASLQQYLCGRPLSELGSMAKVSLNAVDDSERKAVKPRRSKGGDAAAVLDRPPPPPEGFDARKQVLPVVAHPHPALTAENAEVDVFDGRLKQFVENMWATLYETGKGVGLAAPQVGVNLQVMVYNENAKDWNPLTRMSGEKVLINPKIVLESDEVDIVPEECLSFPEMSGPVKRPVWVEVEYKDVDGNSKRRRISDFEARLFQHEFDHLQGVTYIQRLSKRAKEAVQGRLKELEAQYLAR